MDIGLVNARTFKGLGVRVPLSGIVKQEREITIARVRTNGVLTEYRRVKHANGTTMHFKNGSTCTFQEYVNAVGR